MFNSRTSDKQDKDYQGRRCRHVAWRMHVRHKHSRLDAKHGRNDRKTHLLLPQLTPSGKNLLSIETL